MREKILSQDFDVAKTALEESKKKKNVNLVCMSLKHPELLIKIQAVEALNEPRDKASVPCLTEALQLNHGFRTGGSEVEAFSAEFNRNVALLLQKLTRLDFHLGPTLSDTDIKQIIQRSTQWWTSYQRRYSK